MSFISIPEKMEDQQLIELIEQLGLPLKYEQQTYFYKDEVYVVQFESLKAEIKFWHVINHQLQQHH
ncbi:Uncharacterised protein [Enterobacter hormaechei]|uniref:hypothetical protein n=1 Tax=Enterobacter hormaechei TaxID=158836 RepID=UPI000735C78D|nr:hypothetical protein [Enterobacter hormaechei]ELC7773926.1 hypothetical protein [Enterobacter hormaechei]KTG94471.1 hypothetical protein ASV37_19175 [Enterobacter hormaechei subsp. steigerwaltii]CZX36984.1 Uncharacterised protein [Enterobacter hormaechei]